MSTLKPYNALAPSELAPTAANYPAFKHLWLASTVTTGDTNWTDSINNLVVRGSGTLTKSGGLVTFANAIDTIVSGTLQSPGALIPVLFAVGKTAGASALIRIGVTTAGERGLRLATSTGSHTLRGDADVPGTGPGNVAIAQNYTNPTLIQAQAISATWGSATGFVSYQALQLDGSAVGEGDLELTYAQGVGTTLATVTGIVTISQAVSFGADCQLAAVGVMYFTTLPTFLLNSMNWMANYYERNGEFMLDPRLKGLS